MNVGYGCVIADKWIPKGIYTGLFDVNNKELVTSNIVKLNGCTSRYAVVGRGEDGRFMLFFGSDTGSIGWHLNQELVDKNKVRTVDVQLK